MNFSHITAQGTPSDATATLRLSLSPPGLIFHDGYRRTESPLGRVVTPGPTPKPTPPTLNADAVACLRALGYRKADAEIAVTQAEEAGIEGASQIVVWVTQRRSK